MSMLADAAPTMAAPAITSGNDIPLRCNLARSPIAEITTTAPMTRPTPDRLTPMMTPIMDIVTDRKPKAMFLRVRHEGSDTSLSATATGSLVMSRSSHVVDSTQARFLPQLDPLRTLRGRTLASSERTHLPRRALSCRAERTVRDEASRRCATAED